MDPMERQYGYGGWEDWRGGARPYGPWGRGYGAESWAGRGGEDVDYGYGRYESGFDPALGYGQPGRGDGGEHVWRGGMLGWLGSGLRAGAAWVGDFMQGWGALLGGKLKGTGAELGRAMRGRGEQMGSSMERRGERMQAQRYRGYEGRPSRSYHRPDDRILDDVHQRVAMSGIDADEVEIEVSNGVVTISGRVPRRYDKRLVEEIAEQVFGVQEVQNHLRLARRIEERERGTTRASANGESSTYGAGTEARS